MSTSLLPSPAERRLFRELAQLRADIEDVKAGNRSTQMDYSSLMGPLYVRDPVTGNLVGAIGMQPDGGVATIPVGGPPPPKPNIPELTPLMSGVLVGWNGEFAGGAARPSNFAFVAVHVSGVGANFITDASNLVGTLTEAGTIPVAPVTGPQWVRLVGYNTSTPPVTGEASDTVGPVTPAMVVAQAVLDGIVTELSLVDQAVSQSKVKLGAIGTAQIGGQAVTLAQLADGSVNGSKLLANAVGPTHIAPLAVTGAAIAATTITAGNIAANTITAGQVAANTLTAQEINANAITASELAANSVVAGKVAANAITANELAANSVYAGAIIAGAIQAGHLAANSVTAGTIAALAVTAGSIAANAVTAGAITAGAVTASKLEATMIVSNRILAGTTTGTRAEMNSNGFEAWKGSLQTFDVNASTGDVMLLGAYKTASSGSRIELGGANGADVIRLYQGSVYGSVFADPAPSSTAGVFVAGSGSNRGKLGAYPGEAFTSWVQNDSGGSGTSRSAVSCSSGALGCWGGTVYVEGQDQWGDGQVRMTHRNSSGGADSERTLSFKGAGSGEPALYSPFYDTQIVWGSGGIIIQNGAGTASKSVVASNTGASSRTVKKGIREILFSAGMTPEQAIDVLTPKQWNYAEERTADDPAPAQRYMTEPGQILRDDDGKALMDPETGEALHGPDVQVPIPPEPIAAPHWGLIAEEVADVLPEIVQTIPEAMGGLGLADRDVLAVAWLAVQRINRRKIRAVQTTAALPASLVSGTDVDVDVPWPGAPIAVEPDSVLVGLEGAPAVTARIGARVIASTLNGCRVRLSLLSGLPVVGSPGVMRLSALGWH